MLTLNADRICKIRGIEKPFTFMTAKLGITNIMAHNLKSGTYSHPPLRVIEQLCIALNCTPNDLFEWKPDSNTTIPTDHPMQQLKRDPNQADLTTLIKTMPLSQLTEIQKLIEDRNKK